MALARARRNETGFNYWPGFVDALSTLVLSIVFLLSVFLVVQFFLSQEVTGKDKALEELNAKIAQLNDLLSVEKLGKLNLDDQVSQLRAGLASARLAIAAVVPRLAPPSSRVSRNRSTAVWSSPPEPVAPSPEYSRTVEASQSSRSV